MNLEREFFEVFNILPIVKKGQVYTSNLNRVGECFADEDIYPVLNADKLMKLEYCLNGFELRMSPAQQDETEYQYISNGIAGRADISRKNALLSRILIDRDRLYERVRSII